MAESEITKTYSNDEISVLWKPRRCIHSGICVKLLPRVYDPESRPWIKPENATGAELQSQIEQCPSGALSYVLKSGKDQDKSEGTKSGENTHTKVEVISKGPLLLHGKAEVVFPDGRREMRKRTTAFCRCGASATKPYCDGSHNDSDFQG